MPFFVATNFTKLKIILFLKCWRNKFGPIIELFTQKFATKLLKIWVWDPGSATLDKRVRNPLKNQTVIAQLKVLMHGKGQARSHPAGSRKQLTTSGATRNLPDPLNLRGNQGRLEGGTSSEWEC
jgi:hypothetical protein